MTLQLHLVRFYGSHSYCFDSVTVMLNFQQHETAVLRTKKASVSAYTTTLLATLPASLFNIEEGVNLGLEIRQVSRETSKYPASTHVYIFWMCKGKAIPSALQGPIYTLKTKHQENIIRSIRWLPVCSTSLCC